MLQYLVVWFPGSLTVKAVPDLLLGFFLDLETFLDGGFALLLDAFVFFNANAYLYISTE